MNTLGRVMTNAKLVMAILVALVLSLTGVVGTTPALAEATTTRESISFPVDTNMFVSCAAGGVGEFIHFTGNMHYTGIFVLDASGGRHFTDINITQNLGGIGLTTGNTYRMAIMGQDHLIAASNDGVAITSLTSFRIIGAGPENDFIIHENGHVTISSDGTEIVGFSNLFVECR